MTGKYVAAIISQASDARDHTFELDALLNSNDDYDFTKSSYELSTADLFEGPTVGSIAIMETLVRISQFRYRGARSRSHLHGWTPFSWNMGVYTSLAHWLNNWDNLQAGRKAGSR